MKKNPRIAIVGAGFAGLAVAYYWSRVRGGEITLFDAVPPGPHRGQIDAGLVHPYPGPKANSIADFDRHRQHLEELLLVAGRHSETPVFEKCGLFRGALTPELCAGFARAADRDPKVAYPAKGADYLPEADLGCGLWISDALSISVPRYAEGLWRHLQTKGVHWREGRVTELETLLARWDSVILTAGFGTFALLPEIRPKLRPLRGQWLCYRLPQGKRLPIALSGRATILPIPACPGLVFAGATFERTDQLHIDESGEEARRRLDLHCRQMLPKWNLIFSKSGVAIRCTAIDHQPITGWVRPRLGVLTALGSKGLTRHAALARELVATADEI